MIRRLGFIAIPVAAVLGAAPMPAAAGEKGVTLPPPPGLAPGAPKAQ